jgi:hypothetical protein
MAKLDNNHINYLAGQYARFENNVTKLTANLQEPQIAEEYGFDVVEITRQAIQRLVKTDSFIDKVMTYQAAYLADFKDLALAHKKERAKELIKLYESIDTLTKKDGEPLAVTTRMDKKLMVLRDIRAEMGDDIKLIADALGKDKNINVNITAKEAILQRYELDDDRAVDEVQAITH